MPKLFISREVINIQYQSGFLINDTIYSNNCWVDFEKVKKPETTIKPLAMCCFLTKDNGDLITIEKTKYYEEQSFTVLISKKHLPHLQYMLEVNQGVVDTIQSKDRKLALSLIKAFIINNKDNNSIITILKKNK